MVVGGKSVFFYTTAVMGVAVAAACTMASGVAVGEHVGTSVSSSMEEAVLIDSAVVSADDIESVDSVEQVEEVDDEGCT